MSGRGRGGKFNKAKRGGGKHFSRDLQPLDKNGEPVGMWRDPADKVEEPEEESSEEESSEESSGDEGPSKPAGTEDELSREQRKEQARKKKAAAVAKKNQKVAEVGDMPSSSEEEEEESDDDMPANPNHTSKARAQARAVTGVSGEEPKKPKQGENMSRREKEALAAEQSRLRYQKLHAEGKTDEARADLARLALVRKERQAAAEKKAAEQEEKSEQQAANKERLQREEKKREAALGPSAKPKGTSKGKK